MNLRPLETAEPIERGSLLHNIFEVYYSILGGCVSPKSELFKDLKEQDITFGGSPLDKGAIATFAIEVGRYLATKMSLDPGLCEEVFFQAAEYFSYYKNDQYNPIAVEQVGSKKIYEDENVRFIYDVKIDLVLEKGRLIIPADTKTGSRRTPPTTMSNQFMGYCYTLGVNHILINKVGFQKTLPPSQRFERHLLTYTPDRLTEWAQNTVDTMFDIVNAMDSGEYPMNFTACDVYNGCNYKAICEASPSVRPYKAEKLYQITERWDVSAQLELEEA
jgi:hypothetical protein